MAWRSPTSTLIGQTAFLEEEIEAREREREAEWQENVRLYNAEIQVLQRELASARDKEGAVKGALTLAEDARASLARTREKQIAQIADLNTSDATTSESMLEGEDLLLSDN